MRTPESTPDPKSPERKPARSKGPLGIRELIVLPALLVLLTALVVRATQLRVPPAVFEWTFAIGWLALALYAARALGLRPSGFFRAPTSPREWGFLLLAVPLLLLAASAFYLEFYALSLLAPDFVSTVLAEPDIEPSTSAAGKALGAVVPTAAGPIVEEVVFRGVFLLLWAKRWGVWRAAIGTSLLFAILHFVEPFSAFVFGMTMVALYVRTGSLLVPIGTHMVYNLVVSIANFDGDSGPVTLAGFREDFPLFLLLFLVSLAVVLIVSRLAAPPPWRIPRAERSDPAPASTAGNGTAERLLVS